MTIYVNRPTASAFNMMYFFAKLPRLASAVFPLVGAFLPFSLSFSLIHSSPGASSYEEIVACSYLQALQYDSTFFVPLAAFVLMALLALVSLASYFVGWRVIDILSTVLSATSLVAVLAILFLQGVERFTPTSLTMAYLLLCSLVISVQSLTGKKFIDPTEIDEE